MTAEEVYNRLVADNRMTDFDAFDAHVVASILALSFCEAQTEGKPVVEAIGLERPDLARLLNRIFRTPSRCSWTMTRGHRHAAKTKLP